MSRGAIRGILFIFAFTFQFGEPVALAQSENALYFQETGHWVTGEFLDFFARATEPTTIFGPPITEAFPAPHSDRLVQYFKKARLVLDPANPGPLRVRQTPLGFLLQKHGEPLSNRPGISPCSVY